MQAYNDQVRRHRIYRHPFANVQRKNRAGAKFSKNGRSDQPVVATKFTGQNFLQNVDENCKKTRLRILAARRGTLAGGCNFWNSCTETGITVGSKASRQYPKVHAPQSLARVYAKEPSRNASTPPARSVNAPARQPNRSVTGIPEEQRNSGGSGWIISAAAARTRSPHPHHSRRILDGALLRRHRHPHRLNTAAACRPSICR